MGYSGLIYAAIVAAWAAVLVPRWVRRNEEVERAREADSARGVRVLQRRSHPSRTSHRPAEGDTDRTVLHGDSAGLGEAAGDTASAGRDDAPGADPARAAVRPDAGELSRLTAVFADAARRRRQVLTILLVVLSVVTVTAVAGVLPSWSPAVVAVGVLAFLVTARRATVAQGRRRRLARQRLARRAAVAARPTADDVPDELSARYAEVPEGMRVAVFVEPEIAEADPDAWEPVPVPQPTYLSKPMAPRVARTIDLTQPGSWTSGRLDPASSIELPPQHGDTGSSDTAASDTTHDADDDLPEHRWAVGD